MHALRERERKHLHCGRKECYGGLTNETNLPPPGKGEWHTDESLVVGKYAQTRQRRLRGKVVKSGHGRHYKRTLAMP